MAVELAEVVTGLPVAASLALAGGITNLREGRRRAALNEAMHELRRPLQVLTLSLPTESSPATPVESSLQLAAVALERLEREVNGSPHEEAMTEVSVGHLIEEAAQRWRTPATSRGGTVEVESTGETTFVDGDRFSLSQALDNLLNNAIDHGGGKVRIGARRQGDWVRIAVADEGAASTAEASDHRPRGNRGNRHGHGLRVVTRIARSHGGSFTLRRTGQGAEAVLRLPLCRQGSLR
jgi:two-component system, OmpR family, sensor histidine kinase TctE